jgi:hypothetical protein
MEDDKSKLAALLGESSDEDEPAEPETVVEEEIKIDNPNRVQSEVSNFLGDSDDDDDDNIEETQTSKIDDVDRNSTIMIDSQNEETDKALELDQILGEQPVRLTESKQEIKDRTKSKLQILHSYRIDSNQKSYFVRTPNFVKIQSIPYNTDTHKQEIERDLYDGVTSIIRYRDHPTNPGTLESNTRLVKWADGTYQLVIGKSVFNSNMVPTENAYVFEQQKATVTQTDSSGLDKEEISSQRACWECIGSAEGKMILQPSSLQSEIHARMSLKIQEKFKKANNIVVQDYTLLTEKPDGSGLAMDLI